MHALQIALRKILTFPRWHRPKKIRYDFLPRTSTDFIVLSNCFIVLNQYLASNSFNKKLLPDKIIDKFTENTFYTQSFCLMHYDIHCIKYWYKWSEMNIIKQIRKMLRENFELFNTHQPVHFWINFRTSLAVKSTRTSPI